MCLFKKRDKVTKRSFQHEFGDDYVYIDYYASGKTREYHVYTEYGHGIKWYFQHNCERCSLDFEYLLERLYRILQKYNIDSTTEDIFNA